MKEQLKKTPKKISLLSQLLHLEEHRCVLNNVSNDEHVPKETKVNQLKKISKRVFVSNTFTLTNDELPNEGVEHNNALILIVKYERYYVNRPMIDGWSGLKSLNLK